MLTNMLVYFPTYVIDIGVLSHFLGTRLPYSCRTPADRPKPDVLIRRRLLTYMTGGPWATALCMKGKNYMTMIIIIMTMTPNDT